MSDDGRVTNIETLRRYVRAADMAIGEVNRQIAERERASIPTIGLLEERDELITARDTLLSRLQSFASPMPN